MKSRLLYGTMTVTKARVQMTLILVFVNDFWLDMKDDIMQFILEFHRNDKLTKGINNTLIALIQNVESPPK